ncbi:MAG: hypothetical protein OWU32_03795 [Firmicutes bacterium]|nr:hypothetical protein [Bacillota bacterium]
MASYVQVGQITTASVTNAAGQFFGQNVQSNWDSHSPIVMGAGFAMGDWNMLRTEGTWFSSRALWSMPTFDGDLKSLWSPVAQV